MKLARERGFLLADLERLFYGHAVAPNERWFVQVIEPNLAGDRNHRTLARPADIIELEPTERRAPPR